MIFISAPYTHEDSNIEYNRFASICSYAAEQIILGNLVSSPVIIGHSIKQVESMPGDFSFWKQYSLDMLKHCTEVHVLKLSGWDISRGVTAEIEFAELNSIPITYIEFQEV